MKNRDVIKYSYRIAAEYRLISNRYGHPEKPISLAKRDRDIQFIKRTAISKFTGHR